MTQDMVFSSESVTKGHPDKLCDGISDAIIDAYVFQDPLSRASVECAIASGVLFIASRANSVASVDLPSLARQVIAEAGYEGQGFDARNCSILTSLTNIPPEPGERPDPEATDPGSVPARDHVNAFGYACDETPELMPAPIMLAHGVARLLDQLRETGEAPFLAPDGKVQAAVSYRGGKVERIQSVTVTTALTVAECPPSAVDALRDRIMDALGQQSIAIDNTTTLTLNMGDILKVGGPAHHAGLTGRKTAIDTYGEYSRHSSAALSGKDPFRIDRIGSYAARHAALNVVAAGLARRCEVHIAYKIGQALPASVTVNSFGTGTIADDRCARFLAELTDFRPLGIVRRFALHERPRQAAGAGFFRHLAVYGHMGRRHPIVPWEATDLVESLTA
jgi:S-adenosylmethionine synthetase